MNIRSAIDTDYAALARLRRRAILVVNAKDYSEAIITRWAAKVGAREFRETAGRCRRWVAVDREKIIGFCEHDFSGVLSRIYVHPAYLRQGVGSRLLAAAERSLRGLGVSDIRLESTITSKDFYEKNGYKIVCAAACEEDGARIYRMRKTLGAGETCGDAL